MLKSLVASLLLDTTPARRAIQRLHRRAMKAGLPDLAVRMRNESARSLHPGERILEDDAVLFSDDAGPAARPGDVLGRHGWMIVTTKRVIWAGVGDRRTVEVPTGDLDRIYAEDKIETYRWPRRRKTLSVTFHFTADNDRLRTQLHRVLGVTDA